MNIFIKLLLLEARKKNNLCRSKNKENKILKVAELAVYAQKRFKEFIVRLQTFQGVQYYSSLDQIKLLKIKQGKEKYKISDGKWLNKERE